MPQVGVETAELYMFWQVCDALAWGENWGLRPLFAHQLERANSTKDLDNASCFSFFMKQLC